MLRPSADEAGATAAGGIGSIHYMLAIREPRASERPNLARILESAAVQICHSFCNSNRASIESDVLVFALARESFVQASTLAKDILEILCLHAREPSTADGWQWLVLWTRTPFG